MRRTRHTAYIGVAAAALALSSAGFAQDRRARDYDIAAQDLKSALKEVARESGLELLAVGDDLRGKPAPVLKGHYTPQVALALLLRGTDLSAEISGGTIYIRGRAASPRTTIADTAGEGSDIIVTGSRIRGALIASPVIVVNQDGMRNAGENTLADVIRDIPQNFGGGQNPGIGLNVPAASGVNVGSSSTINLRGLGSDATLTLLNGHRLAYNVTRQAIDISAIPVAAVDRIEIVADGSSALYGSDAVAGVANILLKRDFSGVETSARFAASTDGGDVQQQYGVVAGIKWRSGGIMIAYDHERDTAIMADERDYARLTSPNLTLYPPIKRNDVTVSAHQALTDALEFTIDGIYNWRRSDYTYALSAVTDYREDGAYNIGDSTSFAIAPALRWTIGSGWRLNLAGMYGEDRTHYGTDFLSSNSVYFSNRGCYCNKGASIELNADGSLFRLPGGEAKVAFGGGVRSNKFSGVRTGGSVQNINVSQDNYYAFGELNLPFIGPDQGVPLIQRFNISLALRYEDYPRVGEVATPKIGVILSPSGDFDLKGSWGQSFRAPTLYQQYNTVGASISPVRNYGGAGYAATATAISLGGGNPSLKPERATTWTATFALHPRAIPGFRVEVSYYDVRYRDRVVAPITFLAQALSNPIYSDLVILNPSDAQKAAALASASQVQSTIGRPYSAADVVAIINNTNLNVAQQTVHGVDLSASYAFDTPSAGSFNLIGNASYIVSRQQLSALQPSVNLAGNIFNPPHYRGRGGVTWRYGSITLSSFVNHIGGVEDRRTSTVASVGSMTTLDLTARLAVSGGPRPFRNTEFTLSVQNLFNDKPALIKTYGVYEPPYDSTNYSPVGRFISFGVRKKW